MDGFVILVLLTLLGGGALFVWLISAIAGAFGGSARLRRLEGEQLALQEGLDAVQVRLGHAERALGEARREVAALRTEHRAWQPLARTDGTNAHAANAHAVNANAPRREAFAPQIAASTPTLTPTAVFTKDAMTASIPSLGERAIDPVAPAPQRPVRVFEPAPLVPTLVTATAPEDMVAFAAMPAPIALAHIETANLEAANITVAPIVSPDLAPVGIEPVRIDPTPIEPVGIEPAHVELGHVESVHVEQARIEPTRVTPSRHAEPPRRTSPIAPVAEEPPAPAALRPDWERWIGVRGAAALGACVLVIAGLYFFKYSMEQGLLSPTLRVILGVLAGAVGLAASERMARRDYTVLANWLAGAGIAILYIAFWSANVAYGLIGMPVALASMVLVTALCGFLAVRRKAMVIALLGLFGGFVTPLALASGSDHPIGLFGYLLLLDTALLYLAHKRGFPLLAALSLAGTVIYQAGWIGDRMTAETLPLGIGIVLVFAAVFAGTLHRIAAPAGHAITIARTASLVLPFVFGLYFGARNDVGPHLLAVGAMLVVLSIGALYLARARKAPAIAVGSAVGVVTIAGVWLYRHAEGAVSWEVTGLLMLLALIFHGALELEVRAPRGDRPGAERAALIAVVGPLLLVLAAAASPAGVDPWPWMADALLLAVLALRQSTFPGRGALGLAVSIALTLAFPVVHAAHAGDALFPAAALEWTGVMVVTALALHACFRIRRNAAAPMIASEIPTRDPILSSDGLTVLLSLGFALYFALHGEASAHLWPVGAMLLAITAASSRLALGPQKQPLGLITAVSSVAILGTWTAAHDPAPAQWEILGLFGLLATMLHGFLEVMRRRDATDTDPSPSIQAAVSSVGSVVVFLGVASTSTTVDLWPWLIGAAALSALTLRHATFTGRAFLHLAAAIPLAVGLLLVHVSHLGARGALPADLHLGLAVGVAVALQALASAHKHPEPRRWATHAAALAALVLTLDPLIDPSGATPQLVWCSWAALIAVVLVSAARLGEGLWMPVALLLTAFVQTIFTHDSVPTSPVGPYASTLPTLALAGLALTVTMFTLFPIVAGRRVLGNTAALRAAALAGPLFFVALHHVWDIAIGPGRLGLLPVGLAVVAALAGLGASRRIDRADPVYPVALTWPFAVAAALITVAFPLQLTNEQLTIAWALEGAALAYGFHHLRKTAFAYCAVALLAVVTARLVLNPWVLDYHPHAATPVLNWLLPTYGVPALALLAAHRWLSDRRALREAGETLALAEKAVAGAAIVVIFAWQNLTILDAFSTTADLRILVERMPARDLTLSMSWATLALVLLATGMARKAASLRWCSLGLIVVTLGKVFLYDLGHLHDLYRVASLVGLAFSLILISLAYQRFVFARTPRPA